MICDFVYTFIIFILKKYIYFYKTKTNHAEKLNENKEIIRRFCQNCILLHYYFSHKMVTDHQGCAP